MVETYTTEVTVPDLYATPGYGLLDNVVWLTGDDKGHWRAGIQYEATCAAALPTISPCVSGAPASVTSKAATWSELFRGARPFTLFDEWNCSAPSMTDLWTIGREKALTALAQSAPVAAELVFQTGLVNNSPAIVYPNLTSLGGPLRDGTGRIVLQPALTQAPPVSGAVDVVEGLDRLEAAWAGCYKGRGWVHVPARLVNALCANTLIIERGGKLYTWAGNQVIIGRGYDHTLGPGLVANPTGVTQLYMTSPVFGLRDTPRAFEPRESFDRGVNTLAFIAEQTYLLGWQCCLLYVNVTTGGEVAGTVSATN